MPFSFTPASLQPYTPGSLFLGRDPHTWNEVGIPSTRHFLTIAGSGSGKGSSLIIPNLKRWLHNVICIDPGGGNVRHTWQDREAMGQKVYVFDPFNITAAVGVPDRLRTTFNPLQTLDPTDPLYNIKVEVIADGMVLRSDPKHALWDNRGRDIISGIIDMIVTSCPVEFQSLAEVRRLLTLPPKLEPTAPDDVPDDLTTLFTAMAQPGRGALSRSAAGIGLGDLQKPNDYIGTAKDSTAWLDTPAIADMLKTSAFDFSELKTGKTSVFLVLHPNYLANFARFLRLFVRMALDAMGEDENGERCLFILDEFYSLGRIDQVQKAAGLMRKNGVQLWPILQDLGQLQELYGDYGSMTFLGNSDAHIFFGLSDPLTLDYVSKQIGPVTIEDIGAVPPSTPLPSSANNPKSFEALVCNIARAHYETSMNFYHHHMKKLGSPRLTPLEVRELISKKDTDLVSKSIIVFGKGGDIFNLLLSPFFIPNDVWQTHPFTIISPEPPKELSLWLFLKSFFFSWIIWFSLYPLGFVERHNGLGGVTAGAFILTVIFMLSLAIIGGRKNLPRLPAGFLALIVILSSIFIAARFFNWYLVSIQSAWQPLSPIFLALITIIWAMLLIRVWCYIVMNWPQRI